MKRTIDGSETCAQETVALDSSPSKFVDSSDTSKVAPNERVISLAYDELAPHVVVIRPSRSSQTYERVE
jgi:hypothetical protein